MALIKCNNCGKMVSDKAKVCPHCGCDPHKDKVEKNITTNPNLTTCPNCGASISKKAKVCPKCGMVMQTPPTVPLVNQTNTSVQNNNQNIEEEYKTSNGGLRAIVIILALIALVFAGILISGKRYYIGKTLQWDNYNADSDTVTVPADTTDVTAVADSAVADSALAISSFDAMSDAEGSEPIEQEGFHSNSDVMNFVVGNSYSHNDVTLRITESGVYANDNKISKSRPIFKKVSNETGRITARPSISITVKRNENKLIDNNNGDVYYEGDSNEEMSY